MSAVHAVSAFTKLQLLAAGECGQAGGGSIRDQHWCLPYSFCREGLAHCTALVVSCKPTSYNTDQVIAAIRLHSRSRPLPATSQWGKGAVLQLSSRDKKRWFYSLMGHRFRDHDRDQIVAWCHDHRSLKWSPKHSPRLVRPPARRVGKKITIFF